MYHFSFAKNKNPRTKKAPPKGERLSYFRWNGRGFFVAGRFDQKKKLTRPKRTLVCVASSSSALAL